ncbi:MAG: biotin--[acetyl-CoA-carboxylase] ligase [Chloroflexota bacterium]|nr:MAG: biotin--[acetyl-CoA-carboxylase] ligase [Chloroflexota bacterium]
MEASETTYEASIRASIRSRWLGRPLHYYPALPSTNDLLAEMAVQDASAGSMVVTDFQSRGKGRLGRSWLAPAGTSLLFSLLFRPDWPPERAAWLTMIAGLATVSAIESITGLSTSLKWPNDLVLPARNQWPKVGGLLLEGTFASNRMQAAVLGIGVNVNIEPEQLPSTKYPASSLLIESGSSIRRADLLGSILESLESRYQAADQGHSPHEEWQSRLISLGRRIQVTHSVDGRRIVGIAEGVDDWGRILVLDDGGRQHVMAAGDVTLQVDNSED